MEMEVGLSIWITAQFFKEFTSKFTQTCCVTKERKKGVKKERKGGTYA